MASGGEGRWAKRWVRILRGSEGRLAGRLGREGGNRDMKGLLGGKMVVGGWVLMLWLIERLMLRPEQAT
jgi:hypothetical protein